jgi:hypothetical protein
MARYGAEIADLGFDGVWLMGVWQRSPAGVAIAWSNEDLRPVSMPLFPISNLTSCGISLLRTLPCCR